MVAPSRKTVAGTLKKAAISYLLKKGYSCHEELGLNSWGKLRGDVVALSLSRHLVVAEIKSCRADLDTDKKLLEYLPYCNRLYLVVSEHTWDHIDHHRPFLLENGIGVLVLSTKTGYLSARVWAKERKVKPELKRDLIVRLAWRGGTSKRTHRRQRYFLTDTAE